MKKGFLTLLIFIANNPLVIAAINLPGQQQIPASVEPGVLEKTLSRQIKPAEKIAQGISPQAEKPAEKLGAEAEKIKFKLTKVILEDNHVYSEAQLLPLYQNSLNHTISVADLMKIAENITNYYRNNGYILSRAILPPQSIKNGVVRIRIIEGYIDQVKVIGHPKGAKQIVFVYGKEIAKNKPAQIKIMEHYLRIANEVPGATVKAVLEPSKTATGAADLNLATELKTFSGYVSYDNYGTRYIGPNQMTGSVGANSIIRSGDSIQLAIIRTTKPIQLQYNDLSYEFPIGSQGMRANMGANTTYSRPGFTLEPLKIDGDAASFRAGLQYPLIRAIDKNLTIDGGLNYVDSGVNATEQDIILYNDHIRSIQFGGNYNFADRFAGSNSIAAHAEQGLNILGATHDTHSITTSRFGGHGDFTKITAQASRNQRLSKRLSLFLYATGQYAFNPLLSSEQFGFGGSQLGRGYDPAEIIGDQGAAGAIELRMDVAPGWQLLQAVQPYVFYDAGVIWNRKNVANVKQKQSATSMGLGFRFSFTKHFSGNFVITQPLTKQVDALAIIGNGRKPRGFFSLVAIV